MARGACTWRRRGSALFATLGGLLVLAVLASAYARHARDQQRLAHRYTNAETAHQLALSGVAAAFAHLTDPGGADLARLLRGRAGGLEQVEVTLSSKDAAGPLGALVALFSASDGATVEVRATFQGWQPIYPEGFRTAGGVLADPAEKHGRVRVVARAKHGGVEREVECVKAAKVVRPVLPVLPRFTLFAKRSPGDADLNRMEVDKRLVFPKPVGRVRAGAHDALVLRNAADGYTAGDLPRLLDRSGWVFLGGEETWNFNLAFGGGSGEALADGFVLPPQAYRMSGEEEAASVLSPEGAELMRTTFGLMKLKTGLFSGVKKDSRIFARYPFPETVGSASLKLHGEAGRPSPTVVLGRVRRRSLVYSYLTDPVSEPVRRTCFLPYLPLDGPDALGEYAGMFGFSAPPFDRETVLDRLFGDSLAACEPFGSTVLEEPYARSVDHLEVAEFDPPRALSETARLTRLAEPLDSAASRDLLYDGEENARLRLFDGARTPLFEGDLDRLSAADLLLPERVTYVFTKAELARWTADGKLAVRGIMMLDPRDGDLELDRPLEVVEGGVLIARGAIRIAAPITSAPGSRAPLALVSLEGRIVVAAPRVDAQLVALGPDGAVTREGTGPLALKGGIAATALDVPALVAGADPDRVTKTLEWDPRADPARRDELPLALCLDTARGVALR